MKETQAVVQSVRTLDGDFYQLELATAEALRGILPGQALLVRPKFMRKQRLWHPYLREVWYPTHASNNKLTVEVEIETRTPYRPGDVLDVLGPVGNNLRFRGALRNVMLLAYDTPPFPLLMTIPHLIGSKVSVTLVLLGRARNYPNQHLPPEVEVIRGDNPDDPLAWHDQVKTIGWADQVFVVVPPSDEVTFFTQIYDLFRSRRAEISANYLFGIFQSILPCGVGACDACLIRTETGLKHVCVDGPVFDLSQIRRA